MLYFTIYKITNKINNKFYIGKHRTKDINDGYMGSGNLIKLAIRKYGIENFTKDILFVFDNEEDMNNKEKELVVLSENSYNICEGGKGGFSYINTNKLNVTYPGKRENNIANLQKGNEAREKYFTSGKHKKIMKPIMDSIHNKYPEGMFKGKKHKEETKVKIGKKNSLSQSCVKNSQYGTCWITDGTKNKKIKKDNFESYISMGFYKGRTIIQVKV